MSKGAILSILFLVGCAADKPTVDAGLKRKSVDFTMPADRPAPVDPGAKIDDDTKFKDLDPAILASIGVEAYPNARIPLDVTGTTVTDGGLKMLLVTLDPPQKVSEFYLENLRGARQVGPKVEGMTVYALDGLNKSGKKVRVQAQGGPNLTSIHIIVRKSD
jgi:hypothetical protein